MLSAEWSPETAGLWEWLSPSWHPGAHEWSFKQPAIPILKSQDHSPEQTGADAARLWGCEIEKPRDGLGTRRHKFQLSKGPDMPRMHHFPMVNILVGQNTRKHLKGKKCWPCSWLQRVQLMAEPGMHLIWDTMSASFLPDTVLEHPQPCPLLPCIQSVSIHLPFSFCLCFCLNPIPVERRKKRLE